MTSPGPAHALHLARGVAGPMWLTGLLVVASCEAGTPPRVGDPCAREGAGADPDGCADPTLWCGPGATCALRPSQGEVCDPAPCAPGLHCHIDKRCDVSRVDGEACYSSSECAPGLGCNHGELPELLALGLCRAPAAQGDVCGFGHAPEQTIEQVLRPDDDRIDRGDCQPGLACAPLFPQPGGDEAPSICASTKGVACFFSGVCRAQGTLPLGAPCARSNACASRTCAVFDPPLSAVTLPGFGQGGEWLGPHVGVCIAADAAITTCGRGERCPKDFTCLERRCVPPHTQRPGERCSEVDSAECAFGLTCDGRSCSAPP